MTIRLAIVTTACLQLALGTSLLAQEQKAPEKSLYERLGGAHAIAVVVDDFVERIWVNEVLNANPKNKQAMGIEKPALKYLATELVCQVTGGPQKYTGRPLKEVHAGLNISEKEWTAMSADFKASLDKYKVSQKEQDELFAIVGSTKGDIVTVSDEGKK
jgi:hemoglobin